MHAAVAAGCLINLCCNIMVARQRSQPASTLALYQEKPLAERMASVTLRLLDLGVECAGFSHTTRQAVKLGAMGAESLYHLWTTRSQPLPKADNDHDEAYYQQRVGEFLLL